MVHATRKIGLLALAFAPALFAQQPRTRLPSPTVTFTVGGEHTGFTPDYGSLHEAIEAAPAQGAIIRIRPGVYREVLRVDRPNIQLRGEDKNPRKVVIIYNNASPTMTVSGDDFYAENLTIANDFPHSGVSATALHITADRAVLRNVRILGKQDTLVATSKPCQNGSCQTSRQLYDHTYLEGEEDTISGTAKAIFQDCELRALSHVGASFLTAAKGVEATLVFNRCHLTAVQGAPLVYLGHPSNRPAATVFLNTEIAPHIVAENASVLSAPTSEQSKQWQPSTFLAGDDHWDPEKLH